MASPFIAMPRSKLEDVRFSNAVVCAAALFLRNGIESIRMTDIAEASGVGVATLYRHYKTKTALSIRAGTYMWRRFNTLLRHSIQNEEFFSANGANRLIMLFDAYSNAYLAHPDFVRFLDEFDHMVLSESVSAEELKGYGEEIDSLYPLFEDAYLSGLADGSITRAMDLPMLYRTVAHALMSIAQRIVRGNTIPSNDFSHGTDELTCILQMARFTLGIAEQAATNE